MMSISLYIDIYFRLSLTSYSASQEHTVLSRMDEALKGQSLTFYSLTF